MHIVFYDAIQRQINDLWELKRSVTDCHLIQFGLNKSLNQPTNRRVFFRVGCKILKGNVLKHVLNGKAIYRVINANTKGMEKKEHNNQPANVVKGRCPLFIPHAMSTSSVLRTATLICALFREAFLVLAMTSETPWA